MLETFHFHSPLGLLEITLSSMGLRRIVLLKTGTETDDIYSENAMPIVTQLREYFEGTRQNFDLVLDLSPLNDFQRSVLKMVCTIPYGKTRSYKQIADVLGNPKAARAVGRANGHNPIPIVIPCHRVIGKDGDLTGYAYGLDMKMKLLGLENPQKFMPQMELMLHPKMQVSV